MDDKRQAVLVPFRVVGVVGKGGWICAMAVVWSKVMLTLRLSVRAHYCHADFSSLMHAPHATELSLASTPLTRFMVYIFVLSVPLRIGEIGKIHKFFLRLLI